MDTFGYDVDCFLFEKELLSLFVFMTDIKCWLALKYNAALKLNPQDYLCKYLHDFPDNIPESPTLKTNRNRHFLSVYLSMLFSWDNTIDFVLTWANDTRPYIQHGNSRKSQTLYLRTDDHELDISIHYLNVCVTCSSWFLQCAQNKIKHSNHSAMRGGPRHSKISYIITKNNEWTQLYRYKSFKHDMQRLDMQ